MTTTIGYQGDGARLPGFAQSSRTSRYYMGFWPCQQADGDADDEQVTDRSGNGAHATIGNLTPAEAWANSGFFTSLQDTLHSAQVPLLKWTHRFSEGSLIIAGVMRAVKDVSATRRFIGNANASAGASGFALCVSTLGALQPVMYDSAGNSSFGITTGVADWGSLTTLSFLAAYNLGTYGWTLYTGGVRRKTDDKTISQAHTLSADDAVTKDTAIGGWAGSVSMLACQMKYVHALDLRGHALPSTDLLDILASRLHSYPRFIVRDQDLGL